MPTLLGYTRGLCTGSTCPFFAAYYATTSKPGTPTVTTYFDSFNREVRNQTVGFDGSNILKDTEYDNHGHENVCFA